MRRRGERPDIQVLLAIFAGGFVGAVVRASLSEVWPNGEGEWPWATLAVNLAGAFLLGYLVTRLQEGVPPGAYGRPFLGTGLCGALTTFSALQIELLWMLETGELVLGAAYASVTVLFGLAAVLAGTGLARRAVLSR